MRQTNHTFPYDRVPGQNLWPTDGDFDRADAIVRTDQHLQMVLDHPDNWGSK